MSIDQEREELRRVLQSPEFRRAPKLQRLLEFICRYHFEGRAGQITESLIATEAFGKGPAFDPSQDSIVRVQAREARRRLREYYRQEGKDSRVVLDIPIGSYVPTFTTAEPAPAFAVGPIWTKAAVVALFLVAILLAADVGRRYPPRIAAAARPAALTPALARLWDRFVKSDAPTILVLSNPAVTGCGPDCPDEYTGMGEAVALYLVTSIFQSAPGKLAVKDSRTLTPEEVRRSNLVLLGGKIVNPWTRTLAPDLTLTADSNEPAPDVPGSFQTAFDASGKLVRDRALMALRRNPATGRWLMILYGTHSQGTHAVAQAVSDERFLSGLRWPASAQPFPDRFQVLVSVNLQEGAPGHPVPAAVRVP
jgi:hypothetical protein